MALIILDDHVKESVLNGEINKGMVLSAVLLSALMNRFVTAQCRDFVPMWTWKVILTLFGWNRHPQSGFQSVTSVALTVQNQFNLRLGCFCRYDKARHISWSCLIAFLTNDIALTLAGSIGLSLRSYPELLCCWKFYYTLDITPWAQLLQKSICLIHRNDNRAAYRKRGSSRCLGCSTLWSVESWIQDRTMHDARSK